MDAQHWRTSTLSWTTIVSPHVRVKPPPHILLSRQELETAIGYIHKFNPVLVNCRKSDSRGLRSFKGAIIGNYGQSHLPVFRGFSQFLLTP